MTSPRRRHPLNASGDFYVEEGCCTMCGVPGVTAPRLFGGFDESGAPAAGATHCWVKQQPCTVDELSAMVATIAAQEFSCIRYAGRAAEIVERLRASGDIGQVD